MKQIPLPLRLSLRLASGLALFSVLPFTTTDAASIQRSNNQPITQEPTRSQEQNQSSAAAVAEATRLSLTVVKLFNEGKYDEALPLAKRALELRERALGPDHEIVQGALLNLVEIYTAKKKYGEAEKLVERLLRTHEKAAGPDDAEAAIILDKLAFLAFVQGDFSKSEAAYQRALAIRQRVFGPNNSEFATSLYMLAEFYRFTGQFKDAEPLYERSAILRRTLLGREHQDYLKSRDGYFCVVYETHQEKKLRDFEERLGDSDGTRSDVFAGAVLNGRAISLPKPSYPEAARRARAQGTVIIKVTIDGEGDVIAASDMCGGNPLLVKSSLQAARAARFTPTMLSGQPVKVTGVITYNFVAR